MGIQEEIKNEFLSKRELIINAFKNKVVLDNWDGSSPIWVYNVFVNKIIYISDTNLITKTLLLNKLYPCFLNKEDAEICQWIFNTIETEVNNRISQRLFNDFVNVKDIAHGDKNNAYYTSKGDRDYEKESN